MIIQSRYRVDLMETIQPTSMHTMMIQGDAEANRILLEVYQGGLPYDLGGSGCMATVIRADAAEVPITGAVAGNAMYIDLPQEAYACDGRIIIIMRAVQGQSEVSLFYGVGTVLIGAAGTVINPGDRIPNLAELLMELDEMAAAADAAYAATRNSGLHEDVLAALSESGVAAQFSPEGGISKFATELGHWTVNGEFDPDSGRHTPLMPVKDFPGFTGATTMPSTGYAVAYFDEDFRLMTDLCVTGTGSMTFGTVSEAAPIPSGAVYMSICGTGTAGQTNITLQEPENTVPRRLEAVEATADANSAVLDDIAESTTAAIAGELNAYITGGAVVSAANRKSAYALIEGARHVTVEKVRSNYFNIGFTEDQPANEVSVQGAIQKNNATVIGSDVPEGARYVVISCYNSNTDSLSWATIRDSIVVSVGNSAVDITARQQIAGLPDMEYVDGAVAEGVAAGVAPVAESLDAVANSVEEFGIVPHPALPAGYKAVEYLESSGAQGIISHSSEGHYLNGKSRVIVKFAQTSDRPSQMNYLFGARYSSSTNAFYISISAAGTIFYGYGASSASNNTGVAINDTDAHTLDCNRGTLYLDGEQIFTTANWSGTCSRKARVFAIADPNTLYKGYYRIYSYKEYDNGTLIADLIPCVRESDGIAGMYNLIDKDFCPFDDRATGDFAYKEHTTIATIDARFGGVDEDIDEINDHIEDVEDEIADIREQQGVVPDYVLQEADRVAEKVRSVQTGKSLTFIACSDLHYSVYNTEQDVVTPALVQAALKDMRDGIKAIAEQTHIDFYACFGDVIYQLADSGTTTYGANYENGVREMIGVTKLLNDAFKNNPQVRIVGNHDPNCENNDGKEFSAHLLNAYMGIYSEMLVKNEAYPYGSYGYHDFERQKMRLIVLNTSFYTQGQNIGNNQTQYYVGWRQAEWLANQMILTDKEDASDWQIIIFSHVAPDTRTFPGIYNLANIIDGYNKGASGSASFNGSRMTYDFTGGKNAAKLALVMCGHSHKYIWKNIITKAKEEGEAEAHDVETTKTPNLYVPNALPARDGASYDGVTYTKTPGTRESTAFQVVTLDPVGKKVYAHHWGAGIDVVMHYEPTDVDAATAFTTGLTDAVWQTNDAAIATVSDGTVTPVSSGSTMIWAKSETDNCVECWNVQAIV